MAGISSVQKPSEGLSFLPAQLRLNGQNEKEQRLIETLGRRQRGVNRVGQARERRSSEISIKASDLKTLEGKNPREQPAVGVLNTRMPPGTLERVKAQKPQLVKPAPALRCEGIQMSER
jgi:hypothetical protein